MPNLPIISGKKTIKALEKLGFVYLRQKGSHVILKKNTETGDIGCTIPLHKELAIGTLQGILKQARISNVEFLKLL